MYAPKSTILPLFKTTVIVGEQLIAAIHGQAYVHVVSSHPRNHVRRDCRRIAERLIQIPGEIIDDCQNIRIEDQFVMLRPERPRDLPRIFQLVVVLIGETNREGLHRPRTEARHRCYYRTRVDSSTQKGAQRNVRYEPQPDRLFQQIAQTLDEILFGLAVIRIEFDVPVLTDMNAVPRCRQYVAWLQFVNAFYDTFRSWRAHCAEKMIYRAPVEPALEFR